MAMITTKTLVTICFTILFIISFVHCFPMSPAGSPSYGTGPQRIGRKRITCFGYPVCKSARGLGTCDLFCKRLKYDYGMCTNVDVCCCVDFITN
ncbi:hypothetical protein CARUB_v10015101mg [Capsella rubella]|uniref:Knottin scorpion toxin-like domain-containing protein n=1 Tax=Capsella rubella TaxID=81985 RepID=R0HQ27_9BRAS|nr:hypothetical protein CARUB_v10015101mg [Capsella rubella]